VSPMARLTFSDMASHGSTCCGARTSNEDRIEKLGERGEGKGVVGPVKEGGGRWARNSRNKREMPETYTPLSAVPILAPRTEFKRNRFSGLDP
jgi:hypothetical protein